MNWLILVVISVFSDSSRIYIDNYISDSYFKGRLAVAQKLFFCVAFLCIAPVLGLICGLNFHDAPATVFLLLIASGLFASLAGIPYYKALELDNSTNLGIFIQIAPILYLVLGWIFLGETISLPQFLSFFVIIAAPLLIVASAGKRNRRLQLRAIAFAFLYVLIHVIGNLIFVQESASGLNFGVELSLVIFGKGLGNLIIMATHRKWLRRWRTVYKSSHRKVLRPLFASLTVDLIKDFAYKSALTLAPTVALASIASDSAVPIVIFFMGIVLTLICPKIGRETLTKKSILVHLAATILVVAGVLLLQA